MPMIPQNIMPLGQSPTPMSGAAAAANAGQAVPSQDQGPGGFTQFLDQNRAPIAGILAGLGSKFIMKRENQGPAVAFAVNLAQQQQQMQQEMQQRVMAAIRQRKQDAAEAKRREIEQLYKNIQVADSVGLSTKEKNQQIISYYAAQGIPINPINLAIGRNFPVFIDYGEMTDEKVAEGKSHIMEDDGLLRQKVVSDWNSRADKYIESKDSAAAKSYEIKTTAPAEAEAAAMKTTAVEESKREFVDEKTKSGIESDKAAYRLLMDKDMPEEMAAELETVWTDPNTSTLSSKLSKVYTKWLGPEDARKLEFIQRGEMGMDVFFGPEGAGERKHIADQIVISLKELKPGDPDFLKTFNKALSALATDPKEYSNRVPGVVRAPFLDMPGPYQQKAINKFGREILSERYGLSPEQIDRLFAPPGISKNPFATGG